MGWQALGEDELTGDSAVAIAKAAVEKFLQLRTVAVVPLLAGTMSVDSSRRQWRGRPASW